jgi:hypothetical protein
VEVGGSQSVVFVAALNTNVLYVLVVLCLSPGIWRVPGERGFESGHYLVAGSGHGAGQTLAAHPRRSIPRALVAGL